MPRALLFYCSSLKVQSQYFCLPQATLAHLAHLPPCTMNGPIQPFNLSLLGNSLNAGGLPQRPRAASPPPVRKLQALLAEFLGTFFLVLVIRLTGAGATGDVERRFLALGFSITSLVYAFDHISGAHFNPAVTAGMVASAAMPAATGALYICAQVLGALAGGLVSRSIGPSAVEPGFQPPPMALLGAWSSSYFALVLVQQNAGEEKNSAREPNSYLHCRGLHLLAAPCATLPSRALASTQPLAGAWSLPRSFARRARPAAAARRWPTCGLYGRRPGGRPGATAGASTKNHPATRTRATSRPSSPSRSSWHLYDCAHRRPSPLPARTQPLPWSMCGHVYMGTRVGGGLQPRLTLAPAALWHAAQALVDGGPHRGPQLWAVGAALTAYGIAGRGG